MLISEGWDIGTRDHHGSNALLWAAGVFGDCETTFLNVSKTHNGNLWTFLGSHCISRNF